MLIKLLDAAPPEVRVKRIVQAAQILKAEVEAGMWSGDLPPLPPKRRQPRR